MLVIESLDGDTEIRRLSPIGVLADPGMSKYINSFKNLKMQVEVLL